MKSLALPLGWPDYRVQDWDTGTEYAEDDRVPHDGAQWLLKLLGLALTAAALTMGAPFWFDILNKVGNFRSTGQPTPRADGIKGPGPVGVVIDVRSSSGATGPQG